MTNINVVNDAPDSDSLTVNIGKWSVTVSRDVEGVVLVDVVNEKKGEYLTYRLGEEDPASFCAHVPPSDKLITEAITE